MKLVKVNADEAVELSRRFNVRSIPTLLVLRGGQVVAEQVGAAAATALRPWLEDAVHREAAS
jgi:thioredoxin 2